MCHQMRRDSKVYLIENENSIKNQAGKKDMSIQDPIASQSQESLL